MILSLMTKSVFENKNDAECQKIKTCFLLNKGFINKKTQDVMKNT